MHVMEKEEALWSLGPQRWIVAQKMATRSLGFSASEVSHLLN